MPETRHLIINPTIIKDSLFRQSRLHLLPLRIPHMSNLIPGRIKRHMCLVKRILITLVELLPNEIDPLLSPKTRVLLLNLGHATRLIRSIRSLEPPLRVPVDLRGILVRERQGVQRVVDTGGVEGTCLAVGGGVVELAEVEAAGLLGGCLFGALAALGGLGCFFFGELGVAFGLFASCFSFLGFGIFSVLLRGLVRGRVRSRCMVATGLLLGVTPLGSLLPLLFLFSCSLGILGCLLACGRIGFLYRTSLAFSQIAR